MVSRLVSAWQLVAKRSLAHWKTLSSVGLGVVLASAIMSGNVIYFDALRELALRTTLAKHTTTQLDVLIRGQKGPTSSQEYQKLSAVVEGAVDDRIEWMVEDRLRAGRSATFFLTTPGNEDRAGEDNSRAYFAFLTLLEGHTTLMPGGRLPEDRHLNAPDQPLELEAVVPLEVSQSFGVGVGDRLVAVPHWGDTNPYATVVISGVFQRDDPLEEFWNVEQRVLEAVTGPSFRTVPFYISEESFLEVLGPSFRKMDSTYGWFLKVDTGRIGAGNAEQALADLQALNDTLDSSVIGYRQTTALDEALTEYSRRLFFSKLPMFAVLFLITLVVLYYLVTLSYMVIEERRGEVALLRSRGASSGQILTVFVLEGATIAILASATGPLLAAISISVLGLTPAFSGLTGGEGIPVSISGSAYMMSTLGGVLSFIALMIPAVGASRVGVTRHRQQSARPSRLPAFQRYYVDVALLLFSMFLFSQLAEQGSVVATRLFGELVVDQLLLALPGLMLVAAAMVLLRLFPLIARLGSRIASPWLPAGVAMGVWYIARNPTHYARLALLLILTAGLGIFSSSFGGTLERSFEERVKYSTGSEIRVDGVRPISANRGSSASRRGVPVSRLTLVEAYEGVPGVDRASPVFRGTGHDLSRFFGQSYEMLAMDGESLSKVAWFRKDFSDQPMEGLLKSLRVSGLPRGIELPHDAQAIGVRLKADRSQPGIRVTARVKDGRDRYFTYVLGTLESSGWTTLETSVASGPGRSPPPSRPLWLVSLQVHETVTARRLQSGSLLIDDIWVRTSSGDITPIERFDDAQGWSLLRVTPEAISDTLSTSGIGFDGGAGSVLFSWSGGSPMTARGIFYGPPLSPLPVLASKSFLRGTGHFQGGELDVSVGGIRIPIRIADNIELFPTMTTPNQRFLVADLASLLSYANIGAIYRQLSPNEVWLSTTAGGPQRVELVENLQDVEGYTSVSILDRAERLAETQGGPAG